MRLPRALRWVAGTTLGLAVVGYGLHFPGSSGSAWDVGAAMFGALLGVISGVIVGLVQWLALRPVLGGPWSAVASMAVGIGFSHALTDGAPRSLGLAPVAFASAIVLTGAFALAHRQGRPVLLAASVLGWAGGWLVAFAVAGALGLPASQDPAGWATEHAVVAVITGIVWAGLTAGVGFPATPAPSAQAA